MPPRDLTNAESLDCVHLIDASHYLGLGFIDKVGGRRLVGLADVAISIRSVGHHAHLARLCPVALAATRTFQDLRSVIFRDHALELNQELIFCTVALWRFHEHRLNSVASQFLDQQNLIPGSPSHHCSFKLKITFCVRGVATPMLADLYLHYAFDLWAHQSREEQAQGAMIMVRYADDIVLGLRDQW